MTMKSRYVEGIDGIKMDDALKQSMMNNIYAPQERVRSFRSKITMISTAVIMVSLLIFGGSYIVKMGDPATSGPSPFFQGFVITAYAADGTPLVVKPDVVFPLGQYLMTMSSVPGFPITIDAKDADQIRLRISEGELLLWSSSNSKVRSQGNETTVKSGDTIYWSPSANGKVAAESMLEITAYKDMEKLGSSFIEIKSEDQATYKGRVLNREGD